MATSKDPSLLGVLSHPCLADTYLSFCVVPFCVSTFLQLLFTQVLEISLLGIILCSHVCLVF